MQKPEEADSPHKPRIRRRLFWLLPVLLVGGLLWLNGPGLRWLGPMLAGRYFEKAGIRGGFTLEGNFTSGLVVKDLRLETNGALELLTVKNTRLDYRIGELFQKRLRGVTIDGAHVAIRLHENHQPPDGGGGFSIKETAATIERMRETIVPVAIDLRRMSLQITRGGERLFSLAEGGMEHAANDATFRIELAGMQDAGGRQWLNQEALIEWTPGALAVSRVDLLPKWSLRNMTLAMDAEHGPSADAELHVNDAVFALTAPVGLTAVMVDLREGRFDSRWLQEDLGIELPVSTELTSLAISVENVLPDPWQATGSARMLLENTDWDGWQAPELSVDLIVEGGRVMLAAGGRTMDTSFTLRAETPVSPRGQAFPHSPVTGTFNVTDIAAMTAALDRRSDAWSLRDALPPSTADGAFQFEIADSKPRSAQLEVALKPADEELASALFLKSRWQADEPIQAELSADGFRITSSYQIHDAIYEAEAGMDQFRSERIERWLKPFGIDPAGQHAITGTWRGSGRIPEQKHAGALNLSNYQLERDGMPGVVAKGELTYQWPERFVLKLPHLGCAEQSIAAELEMADGWLRLDHLKWSDAKREWLTGSGRMPLPTELGRWREELDKEDRLLDIKIDSAALPLALLGQWLPAAGKIDAGTTGMVKLMISGTYADPTVLATVDVRNFRMAGESELPPADVMLALDGRKGTISLDGSLSVPGHPPAKVSGSMPFRPVAWAENPALLADESFTARAELPRLDLAKFSTMVPGLEKLTGRASGSIDAAGTLARPAFKGRLEFNEVALDLKDARVPPITGVAASIDLTPQRVSLVDLRASCAAGSLRGSGQLDLLDGKPAGLDFRLTGNRLPIVRNESMIVRADADLRLTGNLPRPALAGTVSVMDSLFYRDIELLPIGVPFTTPSAAALPGIDAPANPAANIPAALRDWPLDLRVITGNPFLIRGNFASGHLVADLQVRGTLGAPAPDGEIRIHDLKAALPFSTLDIRKGTLRFTPETGFDPMLEIRASSNPRPYRVYGYIYGRASDPQLVLTSSPPLPENEIMTLLATGTTTSGLENPQTASSRALQLLAEEIRRGRFGMGRQLRPLLGLLDRVDFTLAETDPYSSDSFSTATLSLTDRWFLSAGMSDEGDTRLMGIWRLTFH